MTQSTQTGHAMTQQLFAAVDDVNAVLTKKNGKKSEKLDPILGGLFANELENYARDKDAPDSKAVLINADLPLSETADNESMHRHTGLPVLTDVDSHKTGSELTTKPGGALSNGAEPDIDSTNATRFGLAKSIEQLAGRELATREEAPRGERPVKTIPNLTDRVSDKPLRDVAQATKEIATQNPHQSSQQSAKPLTTPAVLDASSPAPRTAPDITGQQQTTNLASASTTQPRSPGLAATSLGHRAVGQAGVTATAQAKTRKGATTQAPVPAQTLPVANRALVATATTSGATKLDAKGEATNTVTATRQLAKSKIARKPVLANSAAASLAKTTQTKSPESIASSFVSNEVGRTAGGIGASSLAVLAPVGAAAATPLQQPGTDTQLVQGSTDFLDIPPVESPIEQPLFKVQLSQRVADAMGQGIQRARIQINPQELGPVQIELNLDGQQASVNFSAQHSETREAIRQSLDELRTQLEEQGIELAQADVSSGENRDTAGPGEQTDESSDPNDLNTNTRLTANNKERDNAQHAKHPTTSNRAVDLFV